MISGNIKEGWEIILKTSFKKVFNIFLLKASYIISNWLNRPVHWGLPMAISIEPTTSCNLRCPECPSGLRSFTRPTGMLEMNLYKKAIDELKSTLSYLTLYFQGEPYLNPDFFKMVNYASQNGIYTATSTNAHFLSEENAYLTIQSGLNKLIISIDGIDQETYGKYRIGGSLDKVIKGAQNLVRVKKEQNKNNPIIYLQFIVMKSNQHQINEIKKLSKKLGIELLLKTAQVYNENASSIIPDNPKWTRYTKDENGKLVLKNDFRNRCWRMWSSSVISWDGRVVPCCFDKDATHLMGNIKSENFTDIWSNDKYRIFRNEIIAGRENIDICRNCTEGSEVWI